MWWLIFRKKLPLERETSWFILVSVLDIFLTYLLLRRGGFREANPLAFFFIAGWGIKGMIFFKMAMVTFITVLAQLIAVKNQRAARSVLYFGIAAVGFVLVYSAMLLART
ncbi:MAG: hypothetical protein IID45_15970 [Planctomycetes bacterium]|nr:hypothetical protein [Planctomycetota bacterium]